MELDRMLQLAGVITESQVKSAPLSPNVNVLSVKTTLTESDKKSDYSRYLQLAGLLTESDFDEHFWANFDLLEEGAKEEWANTRYGTSVLATWNELTGNGVHLPPGAKAGATALQVIEYLSSNTSPKNLGWVIERFIAKDLHFTDFEWLKTTLQWYNTDAAKALFAELKEGKRKIKDTDPDKLYNDIAMYKTLEEFKDNVKHLAGKRSVNQMDKDQKKDVETAGKFAMENSEKAESGITNIVGTPATNATFHAFTVDNKFSAMYFGGCLLNKYYPAKDVAWCTGVMGHDEHGNEKTRFSGYGENENGKLYIIFTMLEGKRRRFQLHMEKGEFMHEGNHPITKEDIALLCKERNKEYTEFLNFLIKKYYHVPDEK